MVRLRSALARSAGCYEVGRQPGGKPGDRRIGVVFTTIHKCFPEGKGDRHPDLSERRNIVVIADEAHRSQYDFIDGFARHMRDALPRASFIGFTGTPIEPRVANMRADFGDCISIYDVQRAVDALEADDSAVAVLGDETLRGIAGRRSRSAVTPHLDRCGDAPPSTSRSARGSPCNPPVPGLPSRHAYQCKRCHAPAPGGGTDRVEDA